MKKSIVFVLLILVSFLFLTGCESYKSFTYKIGNGDNIEVRLDTSDGYDLTSELPFTVLKDKKKLSIGAFIEANYYDEYSNLIKNNSSYKLIEEGEKNNIKYIFYSLDNSYSYVISIKDSNTGIILDNLVSLKEAKKCFELLTFNVKK